MAYTVTDESCSINIAFSGVSMVTIPKEGCVLQIVLSGESQNISGVNELWIKYEGKYSTEIPYNNVTVEGVAPSSVEDFRTKVLTLLNDNDCAGASYDDTALSARVTTLENAEIQLNYAESISSASGTISIPTGATVLLDQIHGEDAVVSQEAGGEPTGSPPFTAGGVQVIVSDFQTDGDYTLSGTPSAFPVQLIYTLKIKVKDLGNLDQDKIVPGTEKRIDAFFNIPTDGSTPTDFQVATSVGGQWILMDNDAFISAFILTDAAPTNGSANPVQSDGVFDALALKQDLRTEDTLDMTDTVDYDLATATLTIPVLKRGNRIFKLLNNSGQPIEIITGLTDGEEYVFYVEDGLSQIFVSKLIGDASSGGLVRAITPFKSNGDSGDFTINGRTHGTDQIIIKRLGDHNAVLHHNFIMT